MSCHLRKAEPQPEGCRVRLALRTEAKALFYSAIMFVYSLSVFAWLRKTITQFLRGGKLKTVFSRNTVDRLLS